MFLIYNSDSSQHYRELVFLVSCLVIHYSTLIEDLNEVFVFAVFF